MTRKMRKERLVRRTSPDCIGVSGFTETMNDWFGLVCFSLLCLVVLGAYVECG